MKERFLSDFLTRGKVFSFSSSFFIVFAHWKIIASDGNIWVLGLTIFSFQKVPFCLVLSQHSPLRRSLSIWSIHLSQNDQWAMDGISSSAAHHSHFLIAPSWLSIKAKSDFGFRDRRIEEGFVPSPCHLDVFWGVRITSSERFKSRHMDKKPASIMERLKAACLLIPEEDYPFLVLLWWSCRAEFGCWGLGALQMISFLYGLCWLQYDALIYAFNAAKWFAQLLSTVDRALKPIGSVLTSEMLVWPFWIHRMHCVPCVPFRVNAHCSIGAHLREAETDSWKTRCACVRVLRIFILKFPSWHLSDFSSTVSQWRHTNCSSKDFQPIHKRPEDFLFFT